MTARDPLIGRLVLGRYRIVDRLAQGGMGVVYLARREGAAGFVKPVVIKRILPDLEQKDMMGMFVREARILSRLRHPNIAGILDFEEEDGANVMVLEYVHGYDVGQWRRYVRTTRGNFDVEIALHVVASVLDALEHAHRLPQPDGSIVQVIHRDISPSNVLVDTEGHVKLLDFGVARMIGGESGLYKTSDITVKGKIPYVAPELLQGSTPSTQGDLYACAVVLHELLIGRNELRGNDMGDTVRRVFGHIPCSVASVRDDVPAELDAILSRQLSKNPDVRYQSAGELAAALRSVRKLSPEELRARLLEQIHEDYAGMPKVVGVGPLEDRERAWRMPIEALGGTELDTEPRVERAGPSSLPPTVAEKPRKSRSKRWMIAAGAAGVVAFAGAGTLLLPNLLEPRPAEQVFIVQQPNALDEDAASPEPQAQDAGSSPDSGPPADSGTDSGPEPDSTPSPRTPRPTPAPGESLSASFARHRRDVEACLRQHASQIEGAPELSVRFEVARDGTVRSAHVLPAPVEPTPLGACLVRVAQGVRFSAQERDGVSFRIPITVARQ